MKALYRGKSGGGYRGVARWTRGRQCLTLRFRVVGPGFLCSHLYFICLLIDNYFYLRIEDVTKTTARFYSVSQQFILDIINYKRIIKLIVIIRSSMRREGSSDTINKSINNYSIL